MPNSVTSIDWGAFIRCSSLISIDIPNSVIFLGDEVFEDCTSLTNVTIGDAVTKIGDYMFYGCSSLSNIYIGNSVTSIGGRVFHGCTSLSSISLPNSITSIAADAFLGCTGLSKVNITDLEAWCSLNTFDCTTIPGEFPSMSNPLYYANHLFLNGVEIKNLIIPESVTSIGAFIFECCTELTSVTIPNSVTSIGWGAFYGCTGIKSVAIPNSTACINWESFHSCTGLTRVDIGNSVKTIENGAFYNCTSLTDVYCYSSTPPMCDTTFSGSYHTFSDYSATLHVPATSLAAYFTAPEWSKFENIVGDAVAPSRIIISKNSLEMTLGQQQQLTATVIPTNASYKELTWYSTDTNVAIVENGFVTAIGYGECDIFAYCMGMPAICHITVTNRISLEQQEAMLLPNHMLTLNPTAPVMPTGFTVTSSDPTVAAARVMNGKVQIVGIKEGTTTITVTSSDGTAQPATCLVTVYTEPGDMNCDGFIRISDVTALINYLLSGDETGFKVANADLNNDGKVSIGDVTALINILLTTEAE